MRYIVDSNNYVTAISFGTEMEYADCVCTEYTGMVPSGWDTLEAWYFDEGDKLWRWQIIDGELVMDASATAPSEGSWLEPELQYKSVSPATYTQDVYPDEGYDGLSQVRVHAMSRKTLATPGISVNENGVVTASVTQESGYVSNSTKTNTHTLSASDDEDFIPANIRAGVSIFGQAGAMSPSFITEFYLDGSATSTLYTVEIEDERFTKLPDKIIIMPDNTSAFHWLYLELDGDSYRGHSCWFNSDGDAQNTEESCTPYLVSGSMLRLGGVGFSRGCTYTIVCVYD